MNHRTIIQRSVRSGISPAIAGPSVPCAALAAAYRALGSNLGRTL